MSQDETAVAVQSTKTDQQKQILQEILLTEEHYIEDLKVLIEVFKTPILEKKLLSPQDVTRLFSNVESLLAVNEKLYEGLKSSDGSYGRIFVERADTLKLYGIYCSTQSMANVRLKEFTSKFKEFDQFLEKSFDHPRCRQLGLDSFIMSPMQRITKYPLLLGELLKRTPKEDPDNEYIVKALGMMKDIVEIVNERTRSVQNVHRLSDIQRKIIGGENLGLVQKDRELIYQGSLVTDYYGKSKKGVKPWGILFSDFLLLCYFINRPKNEADITEPVYTIQKRVNFEAGRKLVVITEGPSMPEENSFQLIYEKRKTDGRVVEHKPKFYALTKDGKQTWSSKFSLIAKKLYTEYKHSAATIRESPATMHSARSTLSEDESDDMRASSSGSLKSARASMKNFKDFRKKMKHLMDKDDQKLERIDSAGDKDDFEETAPKRKDSSGSSTKKKKESSQDMLETIHELRQLGVTAATENEMLVHCLVQMHNRIKELETTAGDYAQQLSVDFKPRQFDAIVQQTLKKCVPALRGDSTDDSTANIIEKINQVASKYDEHTSPVKEKRSRLVSTGPMPIAKARPMSVNLTNSAPQTLQKLFDEPQKDKSESRSRRGSKSGKLKRTSTEMTGSSKVESHVDSSSKELMTFISPRSLSFAKASPQSFATSLFESPRSRKMAASHRDDESSFKFNTISASSMSKDALAELRNADKPELPPKPARRKRSGSSSSENKKKKRAPTPPPKVPVKIGEESETKPDEVKDQSDTEKSTNEADETSQSQVPEKKETGPPTEYFRDRFRSKSRSRSLNNMVIISSPRKMSLDRQSETDEDRADKKVIPEASPVSSMTNGIASVLSDDSKSAALPKSGSEASNSEASTAPLNNESDSQDVQAP